MVATRGITKPNPITISHKSRQIVTPIENGPSLEAVTNRAAETAEGHPWGCVVESAAPSHQKLAAFYVVCECELCLELDQK
jgi:hypothetical protein